MKHNYADWELTQLLPEENPKSSINVPYGDVNNIYICRDEPEFSIHVSDETEDLLDYYHESDIREAWTWEDIRLYLLSKGFEYTCIPDNNVVIHIPELGKLDDVLTLKFKTGFEKAGYWAIIHNHKTKNSFKLTHKANYEEARYEAIKYCLTKINEDENSK